MAQSPSEKEKEKVNTCLAEVCKRIQELADGVPGRAWLKEIIEEEGHTTLTRYVVGHECVTDKVLEKVTATAAWREEYGTATLITDWEADSSTEAKLAKNWPMGTCGKDNRGRPVQINRFARVDFPGLLRESSLEHMVKHSVYVFEKNLLASPSGESVLIIDIGVDEEEKATSPVTSIWGIKGYIGAMITYLKAMSSISDPHYPETTCKIFFTRVPSMFWATWKITSVFMAARTKEKVSIHTDSATEALLEYMPIESIPKCLGGKSEATIPAGGKIGELVNGEVPEVAK